MLSLPQEGNNSVLAIRSGDDLVEVFDNWGGAPGAKLVADGGQPVTREHRLLSWAGEMEAQLVSQRQDLRRAHMELAAAREEAREARMEAQQLRGMLAAANQVGAQPGARVPPPWRRSTSLQSCARALQRCNCCTRCWSCRASRMARGG